MNINHISVSRKSVWDECQAKYKFRYHLEIPPTGPEPYYFTYGKIVHKIAEEYVRNRGETALGKITEQVISGDIPLERKDGIKKQHVLPTEYRNKLPEHLRAIEKLTNEIGTDGILEYEFDYDLDPPNKRNAYGFIDRLIQRGDNFFILDYKTSKKNFYRKTQYTITEDLQLRTYARVVQRAFDVPAKNIHAGLYYLEGAELISARFSEESLLRAEEDLLQTYKSIQATHPDDADGHLGQHCRRCDYRPICPFYKLT